MRNDIQALTESTYYILISVLKPNYGYGIMQKVEDMTNNRVKLGAGTLYGALTNLLEKEWISIYSVESDSRKKKQYMITELGIEILNSEIKRLKELLNNGEKEIQN